MVLSIELTPEVERQLVAEAARRGQDVTTFARRVLEDAVLGETDPYAGLSRRTAEELNRLADQQGVQPVSDPRALRGDFWPEDEDVEDFLAAVRRWRRGED